MIINHIPTSSKEATTKKEIYKRMLSCEWDSITFTYPEFVRIIKLMRLNWKPILWNSHGIFISYDKNDIRNHIKSIENSIKGFNIWMTKIKKSLQKHDGTFRIF